MPNVQGEQAAWLAVEAAESKKALDVVTLDMHQITLFTDYFVIGSGTSTVHVKAIAEAVEEKLSGAGVRLLHREGVNGGRWVLLDYGDVVVHIFHQDEREYYDLERFWRGAPRVNFDRLRERSGT